MALPTALFWLLSVARRALYRAGWLNSTRLACPVIVVGNITVGGAGKTPLVIALVEALRAAGHTPGVISRGHGGSLNAANAKAVERVDPAHPERYGDEPVLIVRRTGVALFAGRRRVHAAQALLAACPEVDVIISDDGLQHYALARQIEIAVFDERGAGNGCLLPAGLLREPLARLNSVDAVVLNGSQTPLPFKLLSHSPPVFRMLLQGSTAYRVAALDERCSLASFVAESASKPLLAAAGIGNPERFFTMLEAHGLKIERMPLADHFRFETSPFTGHSADTILVTEKDAVKCVGLNDPRIWAVPVQAALDAGLAATVLRLLRREKIDGSTPA